MSISRLCFVFIIEADIFGMIWCNIKEASIATRLNSKINQWIGYKKYGQQAFDSIAGDTVVPYRSLKKFFNYHKLLCFAIYNPFCLIVVKSDFK